MGRHICFSTKLETGTARSNEITCSFIAQARDSAPVVVSLGQRAVVSLDMSPIDMLLFPDNNRSMSLYKSNHSAELRFPPIVLKGMVERSLTHEIKCPSEASLVSRISIMMKLAVSGKTPDARTNGGPACHLKLSS